jgi:hypothetical protein
MVKKLKNKGIDVNGIIVDDLIQWSEISPPERGKFQHGLITRKELLEELGIEGTISKSEWDYFIDIDDTRLQILIDLQKKLLGEGSSLKEKLGGDILTLEGINMLTYLNVVSLFEHLDTLESLL